MLFHTGAEKFPPHFFCSNLSGALGSQNPKNQVNNSLLISSLLPCFFCFRNKTQKIHILLIKIPFFFLYEYWLLLLSKIILCGFDKCQDSAPAFLFRELFKIQLE